MYQVLEIKTERQEEQNRMRNFTDRELLVLIKGAEHGTELWNEAYKNLYTRWVGTITETGAVKYSQYTNKALSKMRSSQERFKIDDTEIIEVVTDALLSTVKYFDEEKYPEEKYPHIVALYCKRIDQLLANFYKKTNSQKHYINVGANSYESMVENGYYAEAEDEISKVDEAVSSEGTVLDRFIKQYPKAELLREFIHMQ